MLKYIKQADKECLCAAVCLALGLDYDEMRKDYDAGGDFNKQVAWCREVAPWMVDKMEDYARAYKGKNYFDFELLLSTLQTPDLTGRGVLCTLVISHGAHAVAFEDGLIMDTRWDAPQVLETWEQYQARGHEYPLFTAQVPADG